MDRGAPAGMAWVIWSPPNSTTVKPMPIGMPIANSRSTCRRVATATTQNATVTQNKKTGNQPETIETLPRLPRFRTMRRAATAAATAAPMISARRRTQDGPAVRLCLTCACSVRCFVGSVWMLIADALLSRFGS